LFQNLITLVDTRLGHVSHTFVVWCRFLSDLLSDVTLLDSEQRLLKVLNVFEL